MPTSALHASYGRPALDALRNVVALAKQHDLMAPVTILVPNNIAGIVARRYLAEGLTDQHAGVAGIYVSTLPRLAEQLAASSLSPRRPATRAIVASAWRSALRQRPGVFERVKGHTATIRALGTAHQELRQLSPTALHAVAHSGAVGADLVRLHLAVMSSLGTGWYDEVDLLEAAASNLGPRTAVDLGEVVLYLPQDLSRAELAFATTLGQHVALTIVAGLTSASRADTAVTDVVTALTDRPPTQARQEPGIATQVLHASDSDEEVRALVRRVVVDLQTVPAHRIAVLYAATSPYARLLHEQLGAAGITFNGAGVRSVHERALAQGLLGTLALLKQTCLAATSSAPWPPLPPGSSTTTTYPCLVGRASLGWPAWWAATTGPPGSTTSATSSRA